MLILISSRSARLLREQTQKIEQVFARKVGENAQVSRQSASKDTNITALREWIGVPSLFATKRLIFIRHALAELKAQTARELVDFLKNKKLSQETTLVFVEIAPLPPATKSPLWAYLKSNHYVKKITINLPTGTMAVNDLIARAKNLSAKLNAPVARTLLALTHDDYDRTLYELDKLSLFAQDRPQAQIQNQDVVSQVADSIETDIFKTISALAERNKKQALTLIHRHLKQGAHPLYLLTMMRYQFKNLILVNEALSRSRSFREIQSLTKLPPFIVNRVKNQLKGFSAQQLPNIFDKMLDADQAIKSGRLDGDVAIDLLALAICK